MFSLHGDFLNLFKHAIKQLGVRCVFPNGPPDEGTTYRHEILARRGLSCMGLRDRKLSYLGLRDRRLSYSRIRSKVEFGGIDANKS